MNSGKQAANQNLHLPHPEAQISAPEDLSKPASDSATGAKIAIIAVIVLAMITVGIGAWWTNYLQPEKVFYRNFEMLARDFYTNAFYYPSANSASQPLSEVFASKSEVRPVTFSLRRILIYEQDKYPDVVKDIREHCDENVSSVKFSPTAPYKEADFLAEYKLSCSLE